MKWTTKDIRWQSSNNGFSLIAVLSIITAVAMMMAMLLQLGGQRAFTAKHLTEQIKAKAYAEAGIDYAYSVLSTDFSKRDHPQDFSLSGDGSGSGAGTASAESSSSGSSPVNTYGDGSFALTLTPIDQQYCLVGSKGVCGSATVEAEVLLEDYLAGSGGSWDYSSMEGFNYAVLSGGNFDFGGCGSISASNGVAKLHSNSAISVNGSAQADLALSSSVSISVGNNKTIDGSVTAPVLDIKAHAVITDGSTIASVPPVEIPDIDLTPYYNWAKNHNEVYNGFSTSSSYTPNGGVIWVNGDVTISSHAVINGSIIATGNIKITGAAEVNPTTTAFGLASRDGDIDNTSSGTIRGLVYARTGNYSQTANGTLIGQLIVNGTIKKGGNSDIIVYSRSVPTPPGGIMPADQLVGISAWQK